MHSVGDLWLWSVFSLIIMSVFCLDFFIFGGRKPRIISFREACGWVMAWMLCAFLFGLLVWQHLIPLVGFSVAKQTTLTFYTGYILEDSLSIDNMFVILLIFQSFAVPSRLQRRVLMWGVMGAVIMRIIMIFLGIGLVNAFHWILYVFGAFLIISGTKLFFITEQPKDPSENSFVIWISKHIHVTKTFVEEKFFIKRNHIWYATPLLLALILVEFSDLIFALDSIPAIFSVTLDPFIVATSNIFAIMGLRAFYFMVAHVADRFSTVKYGVALVLILTGVKLLVQQWVAVPIVWMLMVIVVLFVGTGLIGLIKQKRK